MKIPVNKLTTLNVTMSIYYKASVRYKENWNQSVKQSDTPLK